MAILKSNGCTITDDAGTAQVLIINTCAFLNEARKEAIETVIEYSVLKSENLEKIVVTGCLPQKYADETFSALTEADVFLGTNDYDKFFDALEKSYDGERVNFVGTGSHSFSGERVVTTPAHYAYLKIADGCNNRCTYCLIPKIRGRYVSYPMESLVNEAENLGDVSELILVAQDVTRYGLDKGQKNLVKILKNLTELVNINSVRLLYCYPDMIDDELISEIRDNPKIIKYLDIPLQHSEDRILKLMNRPEGREKYLSLFKKLREEIPEIAIRSTFIAGSPRKQRKKSTDLPTFCKKLSLTIAVSSRTHASPIPRLISLKDKCLIRSRKSGSKGFTRRRKRFPLKSFKTTSAKHLGCFATVSTTKKTVSSEERISSARN